MTDAYQEYLLSSKWQEKRTERILIGKKRCAACHSTQNLHVHHLTYSRIYNEDMADLVPLCEPCHEYIERQYKCGNIRKDMHPLLAITETIRILCLRPKKDEAVLDGYQESNDLCS